MTLSLNTQAERRRRGLKVARFVRWIAMPLLTEGRELSNAEMRRLWVAHEPGELIADNVLSREIHAAGLQYRKTRGYIKWRGPDRDAKAVAKREARAAKKYARWEHVACPTCGRSGT